MPNYEEYAGSEFNEAVEQLKRIGYHWNLCHLYKRRGNLIQWNVSLDCIWMELVADSNEDDEKSLLELNKNYLGNRNQKDKAYQCLLKKETFLRKLQEGQNKGGKKKEDARKSIYS